MDSDLKKYMEQNKEVFLSEMKKLHKRLDGLEIEISTLKLTLEKHINFIDKTYEGLKNPIEGVKRWLGR